MQWTFGLRGAPHAYLPIGSAERARRRHAARMTGGLMLAGALLAAQPVVQDTNATRVAANAAVMIVLLCTAAVVQVVGPALRPWAFLVPESIGIGTIAIAGIFGPPGNGAPPTGFIYVWIVLFAAYFWSSAHAAVVVSLSSLASLWVLASAGTNSSTLERWITTTVTLAMVAKIVLIMRRQQGLLVADLTRLSSLDDLTELPNRRSVLQTMNALTCAAVLMIDVDRFKHVNDSVGHAVGDEVLIQIGRAMTGVVGARGIVGRLGGEEFVVVLPDTELDKGTRIAEQLVVAVRAVRVGVVRPTISVGVAQFGGLRSCSTALRDADAAMYDAKTNGRDQCRTHQPAQTTTGRKVAERSPLIEIKPLRTTDAW
jgi:diguanylate cyclase